MPRFSPRKLSNRSLKTNFQFVDNLLFYFLTNFLKQSLKTKSILNFLLTIFFYKCSVGLLEMKSQKFSSMFPNKDQFEKIKLKFI
jgi:hypothetical protein